eukprot:gnl/Chilomastix_cuspidata/2913.p1 GENE.gnl/Chilomastix_cuspidata/2913~~gnl/Chilomastix_cuspidata/2913.p1  ORF type:complete len:428 (+),score=131.57 gnl/Chilomastix_cuspidata/2913:146-1285(+)
MLEASKLFEIDARTQLVTPPFLDRSPAPHRAARKLPIRDVPESARQEITGQPFRELPLPAPEHYRPTSSMLYEPLRPGVPHRLPLPPLLTSPSPTQSSVPRPCERVPLAFSTGGPALADPRPVPGRERADLAFLAQTCARAKRPFGEALALWNLAVLYDNAGLWLKAARRYWDFLRVCKRFGHTAAVLAALSCLGCDMYLLGEPARAVEYWEELARNIDLGVEFCALAGVEWVSAEDLAVSALTDLGFGYIALGDTARGLEHLARALVSAEELGAAEVVAVLQTDIGYFGGEFLPAEEVVNETEAVSFLCEIGNNVRRSGNLERASDILQEAHGRAVTSGDSTSMVRSSCKLGVTIGTAKMKEVFGAMSQHMMAQMGDE